MATKKVLCKLGDGTIAVLTMKEVNQIVKDKGLDEAGDAQAFHTQNVLKRFQKYMKFNTGELYKLTVIQTDIHVPLIVTEAPHVKYQFYGKVMIDPKINAAGFMTSEGWRSRCGSVKVLTSRNLKHEASNRSLKATSRWDKALSANEGPAMRADLQRFIDRRSK